MATPKLPDFRGMSAEETQAYFTEQRQSEHALKTKHFDVDEQFKKALTVVGREIEKLMHISKHPDPLEIKNHEALVAYTKLISGLKKQMDDSLKDMNPDDVEKIADADHP